MSDQQASRRVNACRLLGEVPEIEEKINSGVLTLTAVAQVQGFVRQELKAGFRLSIEEKLDLLAKVEKRSSREVEKILVSESSRAAAHVKESVRQVSEGIAKLNIPLDMELMADLDRLKEVWSHSLPGATYTDVIRRMAKLCRKQFDPIEKANRALARQETKNQDAIRKAQFT